MKTLMLLLLFPVLLCAEAVPGPIIIDGKTDDWQHNGAAEFSDQPGDGQGQGDINSIRFLKTNESFYFLIDFNGQAQQDENLHYYINFDLDLDGVGDFHMAAIYGSAGYTCKFNKDWTSYEYQSMPNVAGMASAFLDAAEFKAPVSLFKQKTCFQFWAGVFDVKNNTYFDTAFAVYTELEVSYKFTVTDAGKHLARIEAHFKNYPQNEAALLIPAYAKDGILKIDNLTASNGKGKKLQTGIKDNICLVANSGAPDFTVSYDISLNQMHTTPVPGPAGYLSANYMLTSTYWSLLLPEKLKARRYFINFVLPPGWSAVTPWQKQGSGFSENNHEVFVASTFGAGIFEVKEKLIAGTKVIIAIDTRHNAYFRQTLFAKHFAVFSYLKSVFNTGQPAQHLSIFAEPDGDAQWQSMNESGLSEGEAVNDLNSAYYQSSHRIFHTYNAFYPSGMHIEPAWFTEGVNEYFDTLCMMLARGEPALASLQRIYYETYLQKLNLDGSLSAITWNFDDWEKTDYLAYKKGALVAFLLDWEIRKASASQKSLATLLGRLYQDYGQLRGGTITDKIIEETASEIAGRDLASFFKKYVKGTERIKLDDFFSDSDEDGLCLAAEELLGTNAVKQDSDGDGVPDGAEYKYGTDPLAKSAKPAQTVYIDGLDTEWQDLKPTTSSLPAGKAACDTNLAQIAYLKADDCFYFLLTTRCPAKRDAGLNYYLNIDLDNDQIAELQFSATYGSPGYTGKFRKDWTYYDGQAMTETEGLESAVNKTIEFKIPIGLLQNKNKFLLSCGVWDTKANKALDGTGWMEGKF